ncbi:MAG: ABC transporter permease [Candidatus Krumholzibacteria bacterium]|nr:ABC transporter permease [Candidatus Krumholzibacteria bacterium]
MNLNRIRYMFGESWIMLNRRLGAAVISVFIMGFSLLILVIFLLVTLNVAVTIDKASEELRIFVYLEDGTGRDRSQEIHLSLLGMNGVEEVVFVSKSEALTTFKEALGKESDLLDTLDHNPLPDAYRLKMRHGRMRNDELQRLARQIEEWDGIEEVRYGERWLERGEKLVRGFYIVDLVLGLIIFVSVVFVISNTVRLTILYRRKMIDVVKLVGAPNSYIQIPFIIEGAIQGIVAALLALGLGFLVYYFANSYFSGILFFQFEAALLFVLFCAALGAVGSYMALRRFMKI